MRDTQAETPPRLEPEAALGFVFGEDYFAIL
jgi:hypothetical protein